MADPTAAGTHTTKFNRILSGELPGTAATQYAIAIPARLYRNASTERTNPIIVIVPFDIKRGVANEERLIRRAVRSKPASMPKKARRINRG
jgi:hypothetical protein